MLAIRSWKFNLGLGFLLCLPLFMASAQSLTVLVPGKLVRGYINTQRGEDSRRFQAMVPNDAWAIRVKLDAADPNLDLHILDSSNAVLAGAAGPYRQEIILVSRLSQPHPLVSGNVIVEVGFSTGLPGADNVNGSFGLLFETIVPGPPATLTPGQVAKTMLEPARAMYQVFEIPIPSPAPALRVDLFDNAANINLYASFQTATNPRQADFKAESFHGNQTIIIDARDIPKATQGKAQRLYVMLVAPHDTDRQHCSLLVTQGRDVPAELRRLPVLNTNGSAALRAAQATVEILTAYGTASGCLIHPSGLILTNHHVIADPNNGLASLIEVGVTIDVGRASEVAFRARVLEDDADRDLCLLKIDRTIYDQDVPATYRFPAFELGRPSGLFLGDDIQILGYPGLGGLGSRATISYAKGVVAGFQTLSIGLVLKTDATITSGSSGGAALDARFRLVGLPTMSYGDGSGQISYVYTVDMIPPAWFQKWLR